MASIVDSERKWSATAELYIKYFEPFTVAMGVKLLSNLKLHHASEPIQIIECGSGSGGLGMEIYRVLASNVTDAFSHRLCMVDISESMTESARRRMASLPYNGVDLQLQVCDATSLEGSHDSGSFNRYICNMTLHYAPDGDVLLREAARLLAPGGIAGFSVWGKEALSDAFTILPRIKMTLGLDEPTTTAGTSASASKKTRSNFHMGENDDALRSRVLDAGFRTCVVWHAQSVVEAVSAADYVRTMTEGSYSTQQEMLQWSSDQRKQFLSNVQDEAEAIFGRGGPIGLDVCYIIATR